MSTLELISEKARQLSDSEARLVLSFMDRLRTTSAPSASELRRMPTDERSRLLAAQAAEAAADYRVNPDLIAEDFDPPLDYGQSDSR